MVFDESVYPFKEHQVQTFIQDSKDVEESGKGESGDEDNTSSR